MDSVKLVKILCVHVFNFEMNEQEASALSHIQHFICQSFRMSVAYLSDIHNETG